MPIPPRLSVVTLGVTDLAKMRSFYVGLGWETRSTSEQFAAFQLGGAVLALYRAESLAEETTLPAFPRSIFERFPGFTCALCVDSEHEVDAAVEAVREAGGRVLVEPVAREWGGRSGYFADPEGNVWEIAWVPGAAFDERGGIIWP